MQIRPHPAAAIAFALACQPALCADVDPQVAEAIAKLREEVSELRAMASDTSDWLTTKRANEVRSIVRDVLADASQRTSLAAAQASSGFANGNLFFGAPDGSFSLIFRGYMQFRWTFDHRNQLTGINDAANSQWGFEVRRMKMFFEGNVIDSSWKYKMEITNSAGEVRPALGDAWLEKVLSSELSMKVGQFKAPFQREWGLGDTSTVFADRSTIAAFFLPGHAQGVQLEYLRDSLRLIGMVTNGFNVRSCYFNSGPTTNASWDSARVSQYAFIGRGEYLLAGKWAQFKEYTGWRGGEFGALIGAGGQVEKRDNDLGVAVGYPNIRPFIVGATADLTFQFDGSSLSTMFAFRQVDPSQAGLAPSNQFGVVVQGGHFISETVELIAKYEYGSADTMPNGEAGSTAALPSNNGYSVFNSVSAGFNWYISKQRLRVTGDVSYAFDGVGAFALPETNFSRDGTNASGAFDAKGQVLVRAQLQIIF